MELKALARSRKIATVSLLWSKLEEVVSASCKTASVALFSEIRIALYLFTHYSSPLKSHKTYSLPL